MKKFFQLEKKPKKGLLAVEWVANLKSFTLNL